MLITVAILGGGMDGGSRIQQRARRIGLGDPPSGPDPYASRSNPFARLLTDERPKRLRPLMPALD